MTHEFSDGVVVDQTIVGVAITVALAVIVAICMFACGANGAIKGAESETVYLAQQLRCVEKYASKPDIDTCRMHVRERWGITETATPAHAPVAPVAPAPVETHELAAPVVHPTFGPPVMASDASTDADTSNASDAGDR